MSVSFKTFILNLIFHPLFLIVSAVVIPVLALAVTVQAPFISHRAAMRKFRLLIKVYGKVVMSLPYPFIRFLYEDASGEETGACIYVCNHRSAADPFMMALLPLELVQVVNDWPFRLPVLGKFARWAGYLSVKEMPMDEFMMHGKQLLEEGCCIVAFPEGTRSVDRTIGQFHGATFRLALQTGAPIVPVCLSGSEYCPPKGTLVLKPVEVRVRRLPMLTHDEYRELSPFKLKNLVRDRIAAGLEQMEGSANPAAQGE